MNIKVRKLGMVDGLALTTLRILGDIKSSSFLSEEKDRLFKVCKNKYWNTFQKIYSGFAGANQVTRYQQIAWWSDNFECNSLLMISELRDTLESWKFGLPIIDERERVQYQIRCDKSNNPDLDIDLKVEIMVAEIGSLANLITLNFSSMMNIEVQE